ncbi:hypothetical protein [Luteimonas arsenica]|uniref:hypothetical protein n=1 Tax=Luteimonas arsenica TaxID=1586242 RepID=UPI0010556353|nr:hypothetical protein [Luteimonas arsenica]
MSRTKTPAEMQAWAGANAGTGGAPVQGPAEGAQGGFDPAAAMSQLLGEFDALLAGNPAVDRETRDQLHAEFARALEDAAATAATATAALPDRASWSETVQALHENGAIGDDEANNLIRTFDASLQPLERRESRVALEFARRLASEGEEQALAWFRSQAVSASAGGASAIPGRSQLDDSVRVLRSEVTGSKSRRLRGPPGR